MVKTENTENARCLYYVLTFTLSQPGHPIILMCSRENSLFIEVFTTDIRYS